EDERRDPKANNNFRFAPALQFEMVMQGSHFKNALTPKLERSDLDNYRQSFGYENTTDEDQKKLLLDNDGHCADGATQRERSHIAHEHFRAMRVVPKETQASGNHLS